MSRLRSNAVGHLRFFRFFEFFFRNRKLASQIALTLLTKTNTRQVIMVMRTDEKNRKIRNLKQNF